MTAYLSTGRYVPHGVNEQNIALVEVIVATALASADTLEVDLPGGNLVVNNNTLGGGDQMPVDWDALPVLLSVWDPTSEPWIPNTELAVTSHNTTTGKTLLTSSGTVAAGCKVMLMYFQGN